MQIVDYIYSFVYYICLYKVKKIIDTIAPSPQNALCFLISSEFIRRSAYREKTHKLIDI